MAFSLFFYVQKLNQKGVTDMFSDDILEKIFANDEVQKIPIVYQSIMIHVIEKILEKESKNNDN